MRQHAVLLDAAALLWASDWTFGSSLLGERYFCRWTNPWQLDVGSIGFIFDQLCVTSARRHLDALE